jgi:hypothetical protein
VSKTEGKRPLVRPRRRWVDDIKMDLREIGWNGRDWIELAQDREQWRAKLVPTFVGKGCCVVSTKNFHGR